MASVTSSLLTLIVRGKPDIISRPRISIVNFSAMGKAEPISIFSSSAVRSPMIRLYFFLIYSVIAASNLLPAERADVLATMPPKDNTATSEVPPPISTIICPDGEPMGIFAPIAAAIGANIPIGSPSGHMIVDIGGGTSEVAVLSLGGIVAKTSARSAGNRLDAAITEYIRKKYNLIIGERTAEELKIEIGSALPMAEKLTMDIRGRDMISGLPRTISVSSDDVTEAIQEELRILIMAVKGVLQDTPPELSADVIDKGMVVTGGGALLRNLDKLLTRATGVPAYVADESLLCVAKGTGIALDNLESYKRSILPSK